MPDPLLPATDAVQLNREHRLYQADWLLRFYGFNVSEIIDEENPFLAPDVDPKANWALNHLDFFPVGGEQRAFEALLRVPGHRRARAKLICRARRRVPSARRTERKLGIAYKRARLLHHHERRLGRIGSRFLPRGLRGFRPLSTAVAMGAAPTAPQLAR